MRSPRFRSIILMAMFLFGCLPITMLGQSLSSLTCATASGSGAFNDTCTVTLTAPAPTAGLAVALSSSTTPQVTVPATVTVPANATSASFNTAVSWFAQTSQSVTLTANANAVSKTFGLSLLPATTSFSVSPASLSFGNVAVNSVGTASVKVTSTGNLPLTVNSATVTGSGFSVSGVNFPLTLNPGQAATLQVAFKPAAAGAATGQINISTNSTIGMPNATVSLNGSGTAVSVTSLSSLTCATASGSGAFNDTCTVTLTAPAPTTGFAVALSSSTTPQVTVPPAVTVPANATSASFNAAASWFAQTSQSVTLTANANAVSKTFGLNLLPATTSFSVSPASLSFGNVAVNSVGTASVKVTSTGNLPLTVNSATVTGSGFSASGVNFPLTLNPGQAATLQVAFKPAAAGAATGQINISTNSTIGLPNATVSLSGSGTSTGASSFSVNATSVAFGNVNVGSSATQEVIVTSTGAQPVTINAATVKGTGFTVSGTALPVTLAQGQTATEYIQFAPTAAGNASGTLTITSNSSTTPSAVVNLTGSGQAANHQVGLSWNAPTNSSVPVTGYHIYRSTGGSSSYSLLSSSQSTQTAYTDSTVQSGQNYSYFVTSVNSTGTESTASNSTSVAIP